MKYMNKKDCIKGGVVSNIIEELKLLRRIQHDHIVNLRYICYQKLTTNSVHSAVHTNYFKQTCWK